MTKAAVDAEAAAVDFKPQSVPPMKKLDDVVGKDTSLFPFLMGTFKLQGDCVGFNTVNGEKLSYIQADPGQACCLIVS